MSIKTQLETIRAAEAAKAELTKAATVIRFARSQGFDSIKDFNAFLKGLEGSEDEILAYAPRTGETPTKKAPASRGEVSPEFIQAAKEGKTGKQLAEQFGVSVPTVQNWKKKAGLVRG